MTILGFHCPNYAIYYLCMLVGTRENADVSKAPNKCSLSYSRGDYLGWP